LEVHGTASWICCSNSASSCCTWTIRASKSTNKREPFGCRKKRDQNAKISQKVQTLNVSLMKFVSFVPSGLVAPVPVEPQKLRENVPQLCLQHLHVNMSSMFHQGPSSQQFISFFRQLDTWRDSPGKMVNQKVESSMESKCFDLVGVQAFKVFKSKQKSTCKRFFF